MVTQQLSGFVLNSLNILSSHLIFTAWKCSQVEIYYYFLPAPIFICRNNQCFCTRSPRSVKARSQTQVGLCFLKHWARYAVIRLELDKHMFAEWMNKCLCAIAQLEQCSRVCWGRKSLIPPTLSWRDSSKHRQSVTSAIFRAKLRLCQLNLST